MHFSTAVVALVASLQITYAAPSEKIVRESSLRLIKTSEDDPGQWVTEEEKYENFTAKKIGFIDITEIRDVDVLSRLSKTDAENAASIQAVAYPSKVEHVDEANGLIGKASNTNPQSWLRTLTNYNTRHYQSSTGTQAATWLFNTVKSVASANSAITVRQVAHSFNQPSIIATIPGTTSDLVIVGAHLDSTTGSSSSRSPGADDNGSGTVTILEALRVLAEQGYKPKNTLEFHWYGGEEGGLLGSKDVYSQYKTQNKNVLAFVNQDMTGYSPSGKVAVYTDYVNSALTSYVRIVATQYTGSAPSSSRCGYGCSDHASANSNGFPAAFVNEEVFENSNPNIHTSRDTYESIQWDAVLRHIKFTLGFLVEASYI
ncbi:hypothetical protein V2G26_011433 [Clonostachys chloroleuca]